MLFEHVKLIFDLAKELSIGVRVTHLGITLFHSFLIHFEIGEYNIKILSAASLYLACKIEQPRLSKQFIEYITKVIYPVNPDSFIEETRSEFFFIEAKILEMIGFDLDIDGPMPHMISLIKL